MTSIITKQNWQEFAGLRRAIFDNSGACIAAIYDARQCDLDSSDGRWIASCEIHNTLCGNRTYDLAILSAQYTPNFCEDCANSAAFADEIRASNAPPANAQQDRPMYEDTILYPLNSAKIELSAAQCKAIFHLCDDRHGIIFTRQSALNALVKKGLVERTFYNGHSGYWFTALGYRAADMLGALEAFELYANAIEDSALGSAERVSALQELSQQERAAIKRHFDYGHNLFTHRAICAALIERGILAPEANAAKFSDPRFSTLTSLGYQIASLLGLLEAFERRADELSANAEFEAFELLERGASGLIFAFEDDGSEFFAALGIEDGSPLEDSLNEAPEAPQLSARAAYVYCYRVMRNANTIERAADALESSSIKAHQRGAYGLAAKLEDRAALLYRASVELSSSIHCFPAGILQNASYSAYYAITKSI